MRAYGFSNPFARRKSGGWPRMQKKGDVPSSKPETTSEKSMYRWFKRIARRRDRSEIEEQED